MEALLVIVVVVPLVVSVIAAAHHSNAARETGEEAARALGLELTVRRAGLRLELRGEVEGRAVTAVVGAKTLRVQLSKLTTPARLAFTAVGSRPSVERRRAALAADVEVGDAAIDDFWTLDGPEEAVVRALFSCAEVQRFLAVWSRLSLSAEGLLEVERLPEPGPDVSADIRRALELAALLESLADVAPVEVPRVVTALLEARGAAASSGIPVPVPSLGRETAR